MRKHLLGLMLIAGMAGCTSESDVAPAGSGEDLAAAGPDGAPTQASLAAIRGSTANFAALPDRGELLAYGGARKVRTEGAYTWHPVSISEDHALNAIGNGRLVVNTPDGKALDLQYERHEEQPDGNWSWIGRSADGASAVLTFGEKAVFGSISNGNEHYRVRTDRSGAWMVATDPRLVAAHGGRPKNGTDVLMPPESRALAAAASRQVAAKAARGEVSTKAIAVVDLLLGYSSTIATELGSQAAAVTLVSNLAAAANAAYANSGVNMRLRVVHAMSVNYADTTANRDALQQLTGYNVDTQQPITPNSSFNALRAARNEYGADLVAFVRRYREPQQDGCGIAWLLGMDQSGIDASDEAFGYAVVSDGSDRDEGDNNTYFCSQFSLAHELGHLMGQAHDRDNAEDAGVHAYSYGYRESSSTGFFTIMAYPSGQSQIEAPHFANPQINFSGRPTGVANQSDNVRSMNQTMPIVAQFRDTVVPLPALAPFDFNGDGRSDVFWRNQAENRIWRSASSSATQAISRVAADWKAVGVGDFDGDGRADILWRKGNQNVIWKSGNSSTTIPVSRVGVEWQVAGVGDFDGDGKADILWRQSPNGWNTIWRSANSANKISVSSMPASWVVAAIADFDGDGRSDIFWRNQSQNRIWKSANSATVQSVSSVAVQWRAVGAGDFDGDGRADILWRNGNQNVVWRSANSSSKLGLARVAVEWQVGSVGDFDGDGKADILWRHSPKGWNTIWRSGNSATTQSVSGLALPWAVMPVGSDR